ncbi:MAG: DUF6465 family protein [Oscillospiraceae bacterium]|nr:DUF6465 family protein [Oscillospiraceae bacterium]
MAVKEAIKPKAETEAQVPKTSTAAKKPAAKKAPAKKLVKKTDCVPEIFIEYGEIQFAQKAILENIKAAAKEQGCATIKTLQIYIKPEEYKAYYVANDDVTGDVDL